MSNFVEVYLVHLKYVNVTAKRKQRIKEVVIGEQHNTDVLFSSKIDPKKDSSKLEIATKDGLLYSQITSSNLID